MSESPGKNQIFINKLTEIVLASLGDENFGVQDLANAYGISLYKLAHKLHSFNNKTINQFIREVRLQKALEMLYSEELTVSEVAYRTGFGSPAYFNKCFHEFFGYPPGKAKKGVSEDQEPVIINKCAGKTKSGKMEKIFFRNPYKRILFIALFGVIIVYFLFNNFHKTGLKDNPASVDGRITLAIMPFQNLTNDTLFNIWQEGIQINLITSLSNSEELKVRQKETINGLLQGKGFTNYVSLTPGRAGSISKKLNAPFFVLGSINKSYNTIRINAQIIDSKTQEYISSFQLDGPTERLLNIIDSLGVMIHNSLIISKLGKVRPDALPQRQLASPGSAEAYKYFILGQSAFYKNEFSMAAEYFLRALEIDTSFTGALNLISLSYYNQGDYALAREWCLKSREQYNLMSVKDRIKNDALYALYFKTLNDRIQYLRQLVYLDEQNPMTYFNIGDCYFEMKEDYKAIPEFEKALELFRKWRTKPYWGAFYYELGISYHRTRQYIKEKKLYEKADRDFPDDPELMDQHAWLELTLGDTAEANRYIEKWISVRKEESWSEAQIAGYLAYVYSMAHMPDLTEKYYRQALSLEPENPGIMNQLAYFLIDEGRNINEGLELVEKALEKRPDYYNSLFIKGCGLFKQAKFKEAQDYLQRSWNLRREQSIYNHTAFLLLEEAKKVVAAQPL